MLSETVDSLLDCAVIPETPVPITPYRLMDWAPLVDWGFSECCCLRGADGSPLKRNVTSFPVRKKIAPCRSRRRTHWKRDDQRCDRHNASAPAGCQDRHCIAQPPSSSFP